MRRSERDIPRHWKNFNSTFKMLDGRNTNSIENNFDQNNSISDSGNFDADIDDDIPF